MPSTPMSRRTPGNASWHSSLRIPGQGHKIMKAVLCKEYGPPESLVLEDVEALKPGMGQVVVGVKACGVNFPDTLIIQGKYQFKPPMPFAPGGEVAGIVKEAGEGVDSVKVGDRVIAFIGWGGFAEEVLTDATRLIPIPAGMDFTTAAAFVMTYGTSHYALKDRAQLKPGETLLVMGAASTDGKLEVCKEQGADEVINYVNEDLKVRVKELTGGDGVDVIYDPVGGDYSEAALRGIAWGGRHLVIGFTAGEIPRIPLNLPLLKGCSIVGVFWGSFMAREAGHYQENIQELLSWFSAGKLKPHISATYPLEQAGEALNDVMSRKVKGKVVLLIEEE